MVEVEGKQVVTTLSELVNPSYTALVIVDMQRDFCSANYADLGVGKACHLDIDD